MRRLFHKLLGHEVRCRWCHGWIWRWQLARHSDGRYKVMHEVCERDYREALEAM